MSGRLHALSVRMLLDPAYLSAVYEGRADDVSDEERAVLTGPDVRAWRTDPYRQARVLQAILEELPVTAALIGAGPARAFFGSPAFHGCIEARGSVAVAFADWAAAEGGPVAALEGALARLRRQRATDLRPAEVVTSHRCLPVRLPAGTFQAWQQMRAAVYKRGIAWVIEGGRLEAPRVGPGHEDLLLTAKADGEIGVSTVSEALYELLMAVEEPLQRDALITEAQRLGAEGEEAGELIDELVADGILAAKRLRG